MDREPRQDQRQTSASSCTAPSTTTIVFRFFAAKAERMPSSMTTRTTKFVYRRQVNETTTITPRPKRLLRHKRLRDDPVGLRVAKQLSVRMGTPTVAKIESTSTKNAKHPFMSARPANRTPNDRCLMDRVQLSSPRRRWSHQVPLRNERERLPPPRSRVPLPSSCTPTSTPNVPRTSTSSTWHRSRIVPCAHFEGITRDDVHVTNACDV